MKFCSDRIFINTDQIKQYKIEKTQEEEWHKI